MTAILRDSGETVASLPNDWPSRTQGTYRVPLLWPALGDGNQA